MLKGDRMWPVTVLEWTACLSHHDKSGIAEMKGDIQSEYTSNGWGKLWSKSKHALTRFVGWHAFCILLYDVLWVKISLEEVALNQHFSISRKGMPLRSVEHQSISTISFVTMWVQLRWARGSWANLWSCLKRVPLVWKEHNQMKLVLLLDLLRHPGCYSWS
jgi:hypothetical protein